MKLVHEKDSEDKCNEEVPIPDGIKQMKNIFGNHFDVNSLDFTFLSKSKKRFLELNKKWAKNGTLRAGKDKYYEHFSPINWLKLSNDAQSKHSIDCDECKKTSHEFHAMFP